MSLQNIKYYALYSAESHDNNLIDKVLYEFTRAEKQSICLEKFGYIDNLC